MCQTLPPQNGPLSALSTQVPMESSTAGEQTAPLSSAVHLHSSSGSIGSDPCLRAAILTLQGVSLLGAVPWL